MAIENAKILNVRIKNKYDSYENWAASGLVLEAGEIALCHTTVDVNVDNSYPAHPWQVGNQIRYRHRQWAGTGREWQRYPPQW